MIKRSFVGSSTAGWVRWLLAGTLTAGGSAAMTTGCGSSCEDDATCPPEGGGGSSGNAGSAGNAGTTSGGSSGSAGTGVTGGSSGSAGTGTGGAGGAGGDGGGDGGISGGGAGGDAGGGGMGPDPCIPGAPEEGCIVSDPTGIFVAPTGSDTATGDREAPLATIGEAITQAADRGGAIYVCNALFDEQLQVSDDDLVIRGGFECPAGDGTGGWLYRIGTHAQVHPSAKGYALRVASVTNLELSDLELVAVNATAAGESSVAAFVTESIGIRLLRMRLVAGNGVAGANGVVSGTNHFGESLDGSAAVGATGGEAKSCICADATKSTGAVGGTGGLTPTAGGKGLPDYGDGGGLGGKGGLACDLGGNGSPGPTRSDASGAVTFGSVDPASGWIAGSGANGLNGQPGQGGGGGGGGDSIGGKGGGGGGSCGGCGGLGGPGGKGGGASIGLLALNSTITLTSSVIETGNAGNGGNGAGGEVGQGGGVRGAQDGNGCPGGIGGKGATGGAGGGGAGGISVGVLFQGGAVTYPMTDFSPGNAGAPGSGAGAGNDGVEGFSEDVREL